MKTIIVTPPSTEPVSLSEAKAQLRIEDAFTLDDDYISALISAARDRVESYCNQFFAAQSIRVLNNGQMPIIINLPYPNMTVLNVTYTDNNNVSQTMNGSDYVTDAANQTITIISNLPSTINYQINSLVSAPAAIEGVKQGILMIVTDLYELRTETAVGVSLSDNPAVKALLYPYRLGLGV